MRRGQFSRIELIRPCCNTRDGHTQWRRERERNVPANESGNPSMEANYNRNNERSHSTLLLFIETRTSSP